HTNRSSRGGVERAERRIPSRTRRRERIGLLRELTYARSWDRKTSLDGGNADGREPQGSATCRGRAARNPEPAVAGGIRRTARGRPSADDAGSPRPLVTN